MKSIFFIAIIVLPLLGRSQTSAKIDTDPVFVKTGLFCGLGFSYSADDSIYSLNLYRSGCEWVMATNDRVVFHLQDSSKVIIYPRQSGNYEFQATGKLSNFYVHDYKISKADIMRLASSQLVCVKAFMASSYTIVDIKAKEQSDLMEMSQKFLNKIGSK